MTRLVAITTLLLGAGLMVAGVITTTLLDRYLIRQVDDRLSIEGYALASNAAPDRGGDDDWLPSDYLVLYCDASGLVTNYTRSSTQDEYGLPSIPRLSLTEAAERKGEPFTVQPLNDEGEHWRVVVFPAKAYGALVGYYVVGLPLGSRDSVVENAALSLLISGTAIVFLGGVGGAWAVHRSLRPLRQIEDTAAQIAGGDLSSRVPDAPASTEVGRLALSLNSMLTQIEQSFDAQQASEARMRRFVADASHELRTPLAVVRGYGELYRLGAISTPEEMADTMGRVEQSATRMGSLVDDLLTLARLDEGRPLRHDVVDLAVLAADAVADLHALDPSRPIRLVGLAGATQPRASLVIGDDVRLRQVVANLVGNAARHTPEGCPVEVAVGASADGSRGVIEVRDHGPGLAPEHAARIFERFYRVDTSRSRASGSASGAGLGMAIVAAIVAAHAGEVSVSETPGGGLTAVVSLPAATDAAGQRPDDEGVDPTV